MELRWNNLPRRELQKYRENNPCKRGRPEKTCRPFQFQPRREHAPCHRFPRGCGDKRKRIDGSHSQRGGAEQVQSTKLTPQMLADANPAEGLTAATRFGPAMVSFIASRRSDPAEGISERRIV